MHLRLVLRGLGFRQYNELVPLFVDVVCWHMHFQMLAGSFPLLEMVPREDYQSVSCDPSQFGQGIHGSDFVNHASS